MAAPQSVPDGTDRGPEFGPCGHQRSVCGVRSRSLMRGRRVAGLDCDEPLRLVMSCGWVWVRTCERHGCAPCAARHRRRNARVVGTGMHKQLLAGRRLWLLTLTAPSTREHKRWTPNQLYTRGAPRRDCSCHVGVVLALWNPSASACWNRLRTAITRDGADAAYYRATEVQDGKRGGPGRGALHHHVVFATDAHLNVARVQQMALDAGYGCVMDLRPIEEVADVDDIAGYVSKTLAGYVAKSSGAARQEVPWRVPVHLDTDSGEILDPPALLHTTPTYRTHTQSRNWGCTVRQIRDHNQAQARKRAASLAELPYLGPLGWLPNGEPVWADETVPAGVPPPI